MKSKTEIIEALTAYFVESAEFVILFGSWATGRAGEQSDVDIAVYLKHPLKDAEQRIALQGDLVSRLGDEVDCVLLNSADIIITMQALMNGEVVLNNNPRLYLEFKARKISEYIDFKADRKTIEDSMLKGRIYA